MSAGALIASAISLYFTKVNWRQSNRPLVSAFVRENNSGNAATTFNLVLANTGNRPAVRVQLRANQSELLKLFDPGASKQHVDRIFRVFHPDHELPLLRNGEELETSFGASTQDEAWMKYGAVANIQIFYYDLDGKRFQSNQTLKIYLRRGFGGGTWS